MTNTTSQLTACTDKKCMERHKWLLEKRCDKHGLIACKQCKSEKVVKVSRQCEFHPLTVCSCGECEVKEDHQCEGKNYHTREVLRCPFHRLAYQIECDERAKTSNQLVHCELHRGHSNWLEASHNVLLRFQQ